jgi:crossover junction endodeoxyribonuclease RusA
MHALRSQGIDRLTMHIRINGIPAPQGSKRHVGNGVMIESSKAVGPWRDAVRHECQVALAAGAVPYARGLGLRVNIVFYFPRPVSHLGTGRNAGRVKPGAPDWPAVKPDRDKLERAVLDGLSAGGAWWDDCQVCTGTTIKMYADHGEATGCDVWISLAPPVNRE